MSTLRATNIKHELSATNQIVLGADGSIGGTLGDTLAAKAPLASPALTGTPTAPTASPGTNTTQIATTAFVLANAPASGLTLITAQSFSAASGVSVNNVFTSTYDNYRIVLQLGASSANCDIEARVRAAGADATSSVYRVAVDYLNDSASPTRTTFTAPSTTQVRITNSGTSTNMMAVIDIVRPAVTTPTALTFSALGRDCYYHGAAGVQNNTAYDGFTVYPTGGATFQGTLRVYGYQN